MYHREHRSGDASKDRPARIRWRVAQSRPSWGEREERERAKPEPEPGKVPDSSVSAETEDAHTFAALVGAGIAPGFARASMTIDQEETERGAPSNEQSDAVEALTDAIREVSAQIAVGEHRLMVQLAAFDRSGAWQASGQRLPTAGTGQRRETGGAYRSRRSPRSSGGAGAGSSGGGGRTTRVFGFRKN